jgi:hypothetical protein
MRPSSHRKLVAMYCCLAAAMVGIRRDAAAACFLLSALLHVRRGTTSSG